MLIDASFSLCDPLNSGFGYQLKITDAQTGATVFSGHVDPAEGSDLLTAADCLRVLSYYVAPNN
jgi:hypothetical protein